MTHFFKLVLFLTVLFLVVDSKIKDKGKNKKSKLKSSKVFHKIPGIPKFIKPFPTTGIDQSAAQDGGGKKSDYETKFIGQWEILNNQSGVSAMQIQLMPDNTINVYDTTIYRLSRLKYPEGMPCVPFYDENLKENKQDCFAHGMEYTLATNQVRALTVKTDPWCSCGGLTPDGTLVVAGGFGDGVKTARYYGGQKNCKACDWREYPNKLQEARWYATQTILPNGEYIVIGGRRAFSYEFFPREGQPSKKPYFLAFLYETTDIDENNLYPFVHLSSDGNLFIFANNRSLLLNPNANKVVRTYPVLPGGSRNYSASGMSAMLPVTFNLAETEKIFLPALKDCGRLVITDPNPEWDTEEMPTGRVMGDLLNLPNGQLLLLNGAQKGTSACMLECTTQAIPNGKIWVAGSNTHDTYKDDDKFPTETRVEAFSPPYLDPNPDVHRPTIVEESSDKKLAYGHNFETQFKLQNMDQKFTKQDIKVMSKAPPVPELAPPGHYLIFIVNRGVPSQGMWVHIQ
ncbi:unnamed protein product [Sphenostylis stenocarpa]|uniref:Galactose oxidase n=1 Tax=Sphenostylis stenocarpa TaxID=92480 RepID=A0AA86SJF6_9FABA|nr:unnamed protein product [Sphenostylis stenocarpa]